jgi:hypothetical protein
MPSLSCKRKYRKRDRGDYFSRRREENTKRKGFLPKISGGRPYLSDEEEKKLFETIVEWKTPLTQPTFADIPGMVLLFISFLSSSALFLLL